MKNNVQIPYELFKLLCDDYNITPADQSPEAQKTRQKRIIEMLSNKKKRIENRSLYSLRYITTTDKEKEIAIDLYKNEKNRPV